MTSEGGKIMRISAAFSRLVRSLCALFLAALWLGCGNGAAPAPSEALRQRFPAHAARVLEGVEPLVAREDGFARGPPDGARQQPSRDGLAIALPRRGEDPIRLSTGRGFEVRVREIGAAGEGAR